MRIAIGITAAAAALGLMAVPVSAETAGNTRPVAPYALTPLTWNCAQPEGKKFRIEDTSPTERWTRLAFTNPCDHGWRVTVHYRNDGGNEFSYNFTVTENSTGSKVLAARPDWIIKVEARRA